MKFVAKVPPIQIPTSDDVQSGESPCLKSTQHEYDSDRDNLEVVYEKSDDAAGKQSDLKHSNREWYTEQRKTEMIEKDSDDRYMTSGKHMESVDSVNELPKQNVH